MNTNDIQMYIGSPHMNIVDAMQAIDKNRHGVLFVTDQEDRLTGSLTDGDIRRWIIRTGDLGADIMKAMNPSPQFVYKDIPANYIEIMKQKQITALPVITDDHRIADIILEDVMLYGLEGNRTDELKDIPVIIMAGGKGTRLIPYTRILPKPLIPIGDIPIIERIIHRFLDYGITEYYVSVNYKKEMIRSYFRELDPDYHLHFVEEDRPLGTAGGIRQIEDSFDTPIFVSNCDILIDANYAKMMQYHKESGNVITIVSSLKSIVVPYGVLDVKEQGIVEAMHEKPKLSYLVNTGMYIINPECIGYIPKDQVFHMPDLADEMMKRGMKVGTYPVSEDSFLDMGEFEEMKRMEEKLNLVTE